MRRRGSEASLFSELGTPEVRRFMRAPPPDAGAFAQFIDWAHAERATGKYICYGIVPRGETRAAGVFELRQLQPGFGRGELGFVLASRLWGRGLFPEGSRLVLDFAFQVVKVHRIEARSAVDNPRGNAALQKLGAVREGRLREAFWREDHYIDSVHVVAARHRLVGRQASDERQVAARLPVGGGRLVAGRAPERRYG
ncbi:MAG TPA: GNAT family N-acetyltransferase [Vicinamibacterales bacterium]|nr:GNAT family N-acetyltransferase [Vicinamibacterales bacterium]